MYSILPFLTLSQFPILAIDWDIAMFYFLVLVFILIVIFSFRFYQNLKLKREKLDLETKVKERTKEIEEQNEQILKQNQELQEHRNNLERLVRKRTFDLENAKQKAEESDKLKTAFLANISHEIRTPMNAIVGFSELLSRREITVDQKTNYINYIQKNSIILLKLINDLIDIAKLESRNVKIDIRECRINHLLLELYANYNEERKILDKEDIELFLKTTNKDDDFTILTDPLRVREILVNLISNAFKYTEKGSIEFGYKLIGNESIEFYVKDTGIGIPNEIQDIVFERFTQVDSTKFRGSGLGLTISRNLTDLLGGRIWVESKEDIGSTFYFTIPYLPVKQVKHIEEIKQKQEKMDYKWDDKTILIAEDDEFNYLVVEAALNQSEAKVLWAKDGVQAVEMVKQNNQIDLVLMDVKMPNLNGYEAIKQIKALGKTMPIIALTAYVLEDEINRYQDMGCNDFIPKPLKIDDFLSTINKYI